MALPAHVYARAALDADLHVQIEVEHVEPPRVSPGEARVTGQVVRVFKGSQALLSTSISFGIHCQREDDRPPPSGIRWKKAKDVEQAAVVEAYLSVVDGKYYVARYNSVLLDAVTDEPQRTFTEEQAQPYVPPKTRISIRGVLLVLLLLGLLYATRPLFALLLFH